SGSPSVDIGDQTAQSIVNQYRTMYPNIPNLWSSWKGLLWEMLSPKSYGNNYGPLTIRANGLELPNGMQLKYPSLRHESGEFVYTTGKEYIRTHGPRLTENVVQALARIVITDQMLDIQSLPEVDIVMQVHDEIIAIGSNVSSDVILNKILTIMRTPPAWCKDLPLDAEASVSSIYDK
ncbi:MAG TPA: hypothetical protein DCM40_19930, partial [Maribacter sp.]|nr:hypothetical protein [Maribacter sp.]